MIAISSVSTAGLDVLKEKIYKEIKNVREKDKEDNG